MLNLPTQKLNGNLGRSLLMVATMGLKVSLKTDFHRIYNMYNIKNKTSIYSTIVKPSWKCPSEGREQNLSKGVLHKWLLFKCF